MLTNLDTQEVITYKYASFGDRFLARIIDVIIIIIPNSIVPVIPGWLYWSLLQSGNNQATIGQNIVNIKVLSINGKAVSFGQATGRFFANYLNILTLFIGFLLYFFFR